MTPASDQDLQARGTGEHWPWTLCACMATVPSPSMCEKAVSAAGAADPGAAGAGPAADPRAGHGKAATMHRRLPGCSLPAPQRLGELLEPVTLTRARSASGAATGLRPPRPAARRSSAGMRRWLLRFGEPCQRYLAADGWRVGRRGLAWSRPDLDPDLSHGCSFRWLARTGAAATIEDRGKAGRRASGIFLRSDPADA